MCSNGSDSEGWGRNSRQQEQGKAGGKGKEAKLCRVYYHTLAGKPQWEIILYLINLVTANIKPTGAIVNLLFT